MQIGDFVKGKPESNKQYGIADESMTKAVITGIDDDGDIKIKVLEHNEEYQVGKRFTVNPKYFEVIGHVKPFNREEVLDLLRNGCKKGILEFDLRGADLREFDLRGADLRGADLRGANLRGADLRGADLRGADLRGADLQGVDLQGANLRGVDLREANLREANLQGADLRGADLDFSCLPLRCGGLKWKIDARLASQLAYHLCSMQCDDTEFIKARNSILAFANKFHRVEECGRLIELPEVDQTVEVAKEVAVESQNDQEDSFNV